MKKCILLVRVSTDAQSYDEQEREVLQLAKSDGFGDDQIIVIRDKESAIRLTEYERHGLNELKARIEADPEIAAVYCYELSRVARSKKVLFSVIDYLVSRKINLKVKEPNMISLLNPDASVNETSELVITLFAQISESEMRLRKARFGRTREAYKRDGRYCGGNLAMGYRVDDDGYIVPDENDTVIPDIFNMYRTGGYSHKDIAEEMRSRGYFCDMSVYAATKRVNTILNDARYCGELSRRGMRLAPLITRDLFDECRRVALGKRTRKGMFTKKCRDKSKMLKGLVLCTCGHRMYQNDSMGRFVCVFDNLSIASADVEKAVWMMTAAPYASYRSCMDEEADRKLESEMEALYDKMTVSAKKISDLNRRIDILDTAIYIDGRIQVDKGEKMKSELQERINEEKVKETGFSNAISEIRMMIRRRRSETTVYNVDEVYGITDPCVRYDVMHEFVKYVKVERLRYRFYKLEVCVQGDIKMTFNVNTQSHELEVEPDVWVKV